MKEKNYQPTNGVLLPEAIKLLATLSQREGEVLIKIAEGKTNRQIADELCLSIQTVENTRARICRKLKLKGRRSLINWITLHFPRKKGASTTQNIE